ncbi:MAG: zinc ABC transporter permease [Desulfobacterales bacterium GWB2_56_26]|nr:MAG: zinc ABC transporter permease [Desulfobacterales bacterium GWB2_56_26]
MFMRHALAACFALAIGCAPVGMLLVLRRMSLMGDALSHAVLPGAALGFLVSGLSLYAMTVGGIVVGLTVALLAGAVARATALREDASFAALYLISLALGVLIISMRGTSIDLVHVLFGTILAVDDPALILVASITTVTVFTMALIYRPLIVECFDPGFLRSVGGKGAAMHFLFLVLVVLNLVAGFTALGTLMAVGMLMLPAASASFWAKQFWSASLTAAIIAVIASYSGLLLSFHLNVPSGPAIVLVAGLCYVFSVFFGRYGSLYSRRRAGGHLTG